MDIRSGFKDMHRTKLPCAAHHHRSALPAQRPATAAGLSALPPVGPARRCTAVENATSRHAGSRRYRHVAVCASISRPSASASGSTPGAEFQLLETKKELKIQLDKLGWPASILPGNDQVRGRSLGWCVCGEGGGGRRGKAPPPWSKHMPASAGMEVARFFPDENPGGSTDGDGVCTACMTHVPPVHMGHMRIASARQPVENLGPRSVAAACTCTPARQLMCPMH